MRCGYCYKQGHNRRSCPELTKAFKLAHDQAIEKGLTDSYVVTRYKDRIAPKGKRVRSMQCGYCGETGHTRRKCGVLTDDKLFYEEHHNMVLRIVHDYISSCPIGIGSLFRQEVDRWGDDGYVKSTQNLIVIDFDITPNLLSYMPAPWIKLMDPATGRTLIKALHRFTTGDGDPSYQPVKLVTAQSSPLPSDWLEKRVVNVASLKDHEYFRRVGDKNQDHRQWEFQNLDYRRSITSRSPMYEETQKELQRWSEGSIRAYLIAGHRSAK